MERLLHGLKLGDESAYRQLFSEYYELLISYAWKFVRSEDIAREVVQQVFINLFDYRESLEIKSSLKAYLIRSVYNQCLKEVKHDQRFIGVVNDKHFVEGDLLEEAETEALIWKAIDGLPEGCRKIFILNRFEGKKNQEIADTLQISKRTVETQISKALKILREQLLVIITLMNL